jgi:hypothetical protein
MKLEEDRIIVGFHKEVHNIGMKDILRRRNLRKDIWFSSMTINTCST